MAKHSWNYWKKQAPPKRKPMNYVDDPYVIKSYGTDLDITEKYHIHEGIIIPNRVIEKGHAYEITQISEILYINGFLVITENDLVQTVILFGHHPNRDPETYQYCMPDHKKGVVYNTTYYSRLLINIKTYYLNDCFFVPSKKDLAYKRLASFTVE